MLGKNAEQDAVDPRLSLFNFDIFAKCSAAHHLLDWFAKSGLRANPRFFRSARKTRLPLTGKSAFFQICP